MSPKNIMRGIQIILSHDPNAQCAADLDVFYCGDYEKSASKMTSKELAEMEKLGWFLNDETNSWQAFV